MKQISFSVFGLKLNKFLFAAQTQIKLDGKVYTGTSTESNLCEIFTPGEVVIRMRFTKLCTKQARSKISFSPYETIVVYSDCTRSSTRSANIYMCCEESWAATKGGKALGRDTLFLICLHGVFIRVFEFIIFV